MSHLRVGDCFYTATNSEFDADKYTFDAGELTQWTVVELPQIGQRNNPTGTFTQTMGLSRMRRMFNRGDLVKKLESGKVLRINRIEVLKGNARVYLSDGSTADPMDVKLVETDDN